MKKNIKKLLLIIPATGGILLDKLTIPRILLLITLAAVYFLFRWLYINSQPELSVYIFFSVFVVRYIFLFGSFIKNGFADRLKKSFGEEKGFEVYKLITAFLFFLTGSSFGLMINKSPVELPFYSGNNEFFFAAGFIVAAGGFIINIWSALIVGIDIYFYRDLFMGRLDSDFKVEGPYKIFSNPMYGPGQANGYGTALIYGSAGGLTGILLNQIMMYIFFFTIEKPHIKRVLQLKQKTAAEVRQSAA